MGNRPGNPFLLTCEHASNRLPPGYGSLGVEPGRLDEHIAWDPGSREVARALAKKLSCPILEGRYSRLLIDLNRGLKHPKLIAQRSFGVEIPANRNLLPAQRKERITKFWSPYRQAVMAEITAIVQARGCCVHFGVHTFHPAVAGSERDICIGLLYDPSRELESSVVATLRNELKASNFRVRRNYPYRGISDGLTTHCRRIYPPAAYAGIEIEISQRLLQSPADARHIANSLAAAATLWPTHLVTPGR